MITEIRNVQVDDLLEIRHKVLWPDKSINFVKVPEDEFGYHFGLFFNKQLVSIISLFPDEKNIRFRKFATVPEFQGKGLGSKLLEFVLEYAKKNCYERIWCDARTNAFGFYEKFGFSKFSEPFMKENIEYYKIEKIL